MRQALIDELGVDAIVDGIHVDAVSQQAPVAPPPGVVPPGLPDPPSKGAPGGPADSGQPTGSPGPQGDGGAGRRHGVMPARGMSPPAPETAARAGPAAQRVVAVRGRGRPSTSGSRGATALADAGLSPVSGRSLQDNAGWGSATGPAPDWATGPAGESPASRSAGHRRAAAAPTAARLGRCAGRGRRADGLRRARCERRAAVVRPGPVAGRGSRPTDDDQPRQPVTDDSAVSDDDEDIEQSGDVGRSVIEKVLGGRVVQELEN